MSLLGIKRGLIKGTCHVPVMTVISTFTQPTMSLVDSIHIRAYMRGPNESGCSNTLLVALYSSN